MLTRFTATSLVATVSKFLEPFVAKNAGVWDSSSYFRMRSTNCSVSHRPLKRLAICSPTVRNATQLVRKLHCLNEALFLKLQSAVLVAT